MPETKTKVEQFKGNDILKIYKVDENGKELEQYSNVVSFGKGKAREIVKHFETIKKFAEGE